MATSDPSPSPAKKAVIAAVSIGCLALLWPSVFYPAMQTAFKATKGTGFSRAGDSVCCDVIYETKMDLKFFAELCASVLDVKGGFVGGGGRLWRGNSPPPPGTMQRCRQKILELCHLDINDIIAANKAAKYKVKNYRIDQSKSSDEVENSQKLNLSQCMNKYFNFGEEKHFRKQLKTETLPSHIRQERSPRVGPQDKGHFVHHKLQQPLKGKTGSEGGKPEKSGKSSGTFGVLMPVYTVGIALFFVYTIAKLFVKKESSKSPQVKDFHMDPEYRKFVLSEEYHDGHTISYEEYLRLEQNGSSHNLSNGQSKLNQARRLDTLKQRLQQTEAAITTIITQLSLLQNSQDEETCDLITAAEDLANEDGHEIPIEGPLSELAQHLKQLIQQDSAKIAVMGFETMADFPHQKPLPTSEPEVSNIVLEKAVPCDSQLLVAESQCLTHTSVEHIDGWSEMDDEDNKPVIVTGKMTISLLGNSDQAAVVTTQQSQEQQPENDDDASSKTDAEVSQSIQEEVADEQPPVKLNGQADQRCSSN